MPFLENKHPVWSILYHVCYYALMMLMLFIGINELYETPHLANGGFHIILWCLLLILCITYNPNKYYKK